jgi:hypothetical protein
MQSAAAWSERDLALAAQCYPSLASSIGFPAPAGLFTIGVEGFSHRLSVDRRTSISIAAASWRGLEGGAVVGTSLNY